MNKRSLFVNISVLCITALLLIMVCSAWYASNTDATVNGVNGSTEAGGEIIIRKTENGDNISYSGTNRSETKIDLSVDEIEGTENGKIFPGCTGKFKFYIEYNPGSNTDTYDAKINLKVLASQVLEESYEALAIRYINSHLLFFKSYDSETTLYSDWISTSGATYSITETEESYVKEVEIYWLWIENYADIFDTNNTKYIESADKAKIRSYYNNNLSDMFVDSDKTVGGFNSADFVIGITLKKIYFEITAEKK